GPDQKGEADATNVSDDGAERSGQPALPRTNSMNVPVGTPVGPRGMATRSVSEYAVPAMSRCTHGYSSANSFKNIAAVIVPPARPPVFLMSATSDLIKSLYSSHNGSCHPGSAARLAAVNTSSTRP